MDEATARQLGTRIALLREQRGMSLGDLADATGIAKSYFSKLEKGESLNLGLATLASVAKVLGMTVHDLLPRPGLPEAGDAVRVSESSVRFEVIADDIPAALQAFLEEERASGHPVPDDTARALAVLKLRGKRPETKEDYRLLYAVLRRVT